MATKRKKAAAKSKAAKSKTADKAEKPDLTDQEIFDDFGIGTESASLPMRKFIVGQRKINGHLYLAIDAILAHITKDGTTPDLEAAKKRSDAIPDEPPACCRSNTGCGGN